MQTLKSKCCDAQLTVSSGGTTRYYVCDNCQEPADVRPGPNPEFEQTYTERDLLRAERDLLQRELDAVTCAGNLEHAAKVARARQKEIEDLTSELAGNKACLRLLLDAIVLGAARLKAWQDCAKELRTCLTGTYTGERYWDQREQAIERFDELNKV